MFIALGGCYNAVMWICMENNHVNLFMLAGFHTKTQSPWGQQPTEVFIYVFLLSEITNANGKSIL